MESISYRASMTMVNRFGWNGGNEYEDEGELNYSNTFYRKYDAQIGRFTGVDMYAESYADLNPYQFGANNPVMFNDPMGDKLAGMSKGPDNNYHADWMSGLLWADKGFHSGEYWGDDDGSGYGGGGGGGNYQNIQGITSGSVLGQMRFGDRFVQNKKGEYGFWRYWNGGKGATVLGALETVVVHIDFVLLSGRGLGDPNYGRDHMASYNPNATNWAGSWDRLNNGYWGSVAGPVTGISKILYGVADGIYTTGSSVVNGRAQARNMKGEHLLSTYGTKGTFIVQASALFGTMSLAIGGVGGATAKNLAMTADQVALKSLVSEATLGGRQALIQSEAKAAMQMASEVSYPGFRASAADLSTVNNHWIGGPHFHMPGVGSGHIPVIFP
jgi:RHS repeat-associated protein